MMDLWELETSVKIFCKAAPERHSPGRGEELEPLGVRLLDCKQQNRVNSSHQPFSKLQNVFDEIQGQIWEQNERRNRQLAESREESRSVHSKVDTFLVEKEMKHETEANRNYDTICNKYFELLLK